MPLAAGTRLGPYEVISPAGAGGMGEVYRARDSRLNREVAIKVLPAAFASDPERLRRFQQEAQAIAALNHPNILAIHDFGEHEGLPYIVTELLEGETLRERLRSAAMPPRRAVESAEQVARGLAAAHEKGIVHRDLKPENIFVGRDGRVKILDFGLAKLIRAEAVASDAATLVSQTEPGVVMGTVGYMSPEQVRGHSVDHRSDLFSFGAILYEMLSGRRAFQKATSAETLTAILNEDPPPFPATMLTTSPGMQRILQRCLEKNPEQRFQSASDLAFALGTIADLSSSSMVAVKGSSGRWWRRWLRLAAEVSLIAVAMILFLARHSSEPPRSSVQAAILPPPGDGFWGNVTQPAAISPDGRFLAIIAMRNGQKQLWMRRLDAADAQPIAGSEGASNPFWSPDGRYVAFFVPGKLKKMDVAGGAVSDICSAGTFAMGGAWSARGVIVFATLASALKRVSASGGAPEAIPGAELANDSVGQQWPSFLPDGTHFLYLDWRYPTHVSHDDSVWVGSLDGEKARRLPLTSTNAQYSAGYLLFSRDGDLVAQRFDASRLELSGVTFPVARNIEYDTFFHDAMFTASANGTLVYGSAGAGVNTVLTWLDRQGRALGSLGQPDQFFGQAISPDGRHVAIGAKPAEGREKIWIYDVERGTRIPLVADESGPSLYAPVWSPDGKLIAFRDSVGKISTVLIHASDGSGEDTQPGGGIRADVLTVSGWSPDGRYLAVDLTKFQGRENWQNTIRVVGVEGTGKPALEIEHAGGGRFSPDGHWLAYSDENSGELYVTPFPGPGARIAVSSTGGGDPHWRRDGKELFYVNGDLTVVAAQVRESAQEFQVLSSQPLFRLQLPENVEDYDVTADGQRFLVNTRTYKQQTEALTLLTDWRAQLQNGSTGDVH